MDFLRNVLRLKNDSAAHIVLLSVYSGTKEGEARTPSQPELRQDAESKAFSYRFYICSYTLRST